MEIKKLTVEYQRYPLGLDDKHPRFSWVMISEKQNTLQCAYQIQVIAGDEMKWDTGIVESSQSVHIPYEGEELTPETIYEYRVTVWCNNGEKAIEKGCFETGLMDPTKISARWITHPFSPEEKACPVFKSSFSMEKKAARARMYVTALGLYEVSINGKRVGEDRFTPGWTNYRKRLQYQTYDITELLADHNSIEITAADGWYKGEFGFMLQPNNYGDRVAVLAEIHITYEDGSFAQIGTGEDWKVTTGTIRSSGIYMGETIDSTAEVQPEESAVLYEYPMSNLIAQENEPVRITKRIKAKKMFTTPRGERVLDFGQNMAGIVEVKVKGEKGQKIVIRHAEVLDKDGNFYPDTLRSAKSIDTYICNGSEQTFLPHFTFHGFRYICVEGLEEINPDHFTACTLHSDMEQTGFFSCSDEYVNRLQKNIEWGQRSNFLDIPTDCPQRDERLGWTGDAQVFSRTASFNMNTARFFTKWLHDLSSEQSKEYGVPHVIPNILADQDGAAAWSDAATIIPWNVYMTFGDTRLLSDQYESMKGWVDYIQSKCGENGLWQTGFQYGDWLALDKEESADRTGATDKYLVANAYYAYSTDLVRKTAHVLGKTVDEEKYGTLYEKIMKAFREEYITRTGRIVSETQTGCILALYFNLAEKKDRTRILQSLVTNIANHKNHLATGFVGTPYLCHVLSENGRHDLAGTLFLRDDYPSWLYAIKKGATTIWERWDSIKPDGSFDTSGMNSLNHYAYGSIGDWMVEKLAGLKPIEAGYHSFEIRPQFIKGITSVDASFESVYGTIRSAYICRDGKITVDITIPVNTTASVFLPEKEGALSLGSGNYHFEYPTETVLEADPYSFEMTLGALVQDAAAVEMLNNAMPGMLDGPMIQFAYGMTISELTAVMPAEGKQLFQSVICALNEREKQRR